MKQIIIAITIALSVSTMTTYAQSSTYVSGYVTRSGQHVQGYYRQTPGPKVATDIYGNGYSKPENLKRDQDGDGLTGYFDKNDRVDYRQQTLSTYSAPPATQYATPSYQTYSAPTYTAPASPQPVYVGPRGGVYHSSPSGNKVYH